MLTFTFHYGLQRKINNYLSFLGSTKKSAESSSNNVKDLTTKVEQLNNQLFSTTDELNNSQVAYFLILAGPTIFLNLFLFIFVFHIFIVFILFQVKTELYVKTLKEIYESIGTALPLVAPKIENEIPDPVKEEENE